MAKVASQDAKTNGRASGPRWLAGFGYGYMQWVGNVNRRKTLSETMNRGIPLDNPVVLTAWGLARKGQAETATAVLRAYGLSGKFIVRRKTLVPIGPRPQPQPKPVRSGPE